MPITLRQSAQPTLADHRTAVAYGMKVCCNSVTVKGVFPAYRNGVTRKSESKRRTYCWPRVTPAIRWKIKRKISASYKSQWGLRLTIKCRFCSGEPSDQPERSRPVLEALPGLLEQGGQPYSARAIRCCRKVSFAAAAEYPGRRSDWLSRSIFASHYGRADVILVPSRFEPCA